MKTLTKFWKFIVNPRFLSVVAIILSTYTLWDNIFRFTINVAAGRQVKLLVGRIDKGKINPIILMSLAFTNQGGKTGYLGDVKLKVTLTSDGRDFWHEEFIPKREYDTLLAKGKNIKQTEILPIVIAGKSTVVKKYAFFPIKNIQQDKIPKSFDLKIEVYTKQGNKWSSKKEYEIKNLSDIWQDLNKNAWKDTIRDMFEKS
ncbi:MAG: hypothetical protein MUP30_12510 [Deltaproteobacteria bacterium]|nr:hypothetical protein [Deltaproteobacteria bacterium]